MNKKLFLILLSSTLLISCNQTSDSLTNSSSPIQSEDSSEPIVEKEYYATINSYNDIVFLYGIKGESFDLSTIDTSRCFNGVPTFKTTKQGIEIKENKIFFLEKGMYVIEAVYDGLTQYTLQVIVNESEEERYNYPKELDLNNFSLQSGKASYVTPSESSLLLQADSTPWNRITYPLDSNYNKNYTIECDVTFKNTTDQSRWFGLVFRDQEQKNQKYPYYQLDFRQNTALNNSVELTYVYSDGGYSYPYTGSWGNDNPGILTSEDKIHITLSLQDATAFCSLSTGNYSHSFEVNLPNISNGDFGFQASGATVLIENIKISLDPNVKVSSNANTEDSLVNIYDNGVVGLMPHLIASGSFAEEIYGVNANTQQFFAKVKDRDLFSINDEKMDVTLNDAFLEFSGTFIPNLEINDLTSLENVVEVCKSFGISDLVIWSKEESVLKDAKQKMPYARLGYIPTNVTSFETYNEVGEICRKAGKSYANLILIDYELLNKENIIKATSLGYTIVANAKNGDNFSVIDSALDGCKLILVNYSPNVLNQTNTLYNKSIFNINEDYTSYQSQTHSLLSIPYVTGHRGAGNTGVNPDTNLPENTIESFKWAYDHGAQAIEIDIHTTKDKDLAVIHNETTQEYSNKNLSVKNSTMAQLQAIQLYGKGHILTDYHIPSLSELFDALNSEEKYNDKAMVVEVKDGLTSTGIKAIELAKEKGWYNRITIITFSEKVAQELRAYDPGIQVSYLNTVKRTNNEEFWASVNSYLSLGVGLGSQHSTISTEALQESNARGYMYWLWTFNNTDYNALTKHIIDGNRAYTTNYVSFFTNNKYKLHVDNNLKVQANDSIEINAISTTYAGETTEEKDIELILLSNNATIEGNKVSRISDGNIYLIAKHKAEWILGNTTTTFYIYSDLITIK